VANETNEKPAGWEVYMAKVEELHKAGLLQSAAFPVLLLAGIELAQASWQQGADDVTKAIHELQKP
jgi:hypothetical protein